MCGPSIVSLGRVVMEKLTYRILPTIGRIAAFQLNFWGNTKIGQSIP